MARRNKKTKIRWSSSGGGGAKARGGWFGRLVSWTLVAAIWGALALAAAVGWYAYDLPSVTTLVQSGRQPSVTLVGADGSRIAAVGEVYGETVRVQDLPPSVPRAVVAIEDRRFYGHLGLDFRGLARAMWANVRAGRVVQGGSTITQQLAKNLFLTPDRTIRRKVQELLFALWLERKFTKDQILTLYLNRVYFGAGSYGVDAAARRFFGKPARQLTLYESAMLAGLLKAPSRYNPASDAGGADERAGLVLEAMVEAGFATRDEVEAARAAGASSRPLAVSRGRYFVDWILGQVNDYVGRIDSDLVVTTTLNPRLQEIAEAELQALLEAEGEARGVTQAAFVAMTPDGAVRAMVGGRDYRESQFNRAVQALRQPGSAFKMFTYLAAMEQGYEPDDRFEDAPVELSGWRPANYGDKYYGEVTLREGFARSLNSVAVRLVQKVGPNDVIDAARRLGITSDLEPAATIALGASEVTLLELTGAYAVFASGGQGVWPFGIEEIRTASGRSIYRRGGDGPGQVVGPRSVDRMVNMMTATTEWGTGKAAKIGRPAAGKTGTSQEFRDAWYVGYTADLVAGVWFGNDDEAPMKGVTGGSLPARLWGRVAARAHQGVPESPLPGGQMAVAERGDTFIERLLRRLGGGSGEETGGDQPARRSNAETRFERNRADR